MSGKMKNKLAEMTDAIAGSLNPENSPGQGDYTYSAVYTVPKTKQILGLWQVLEHTVGGVPFLDDHFASTFADINAEETGYEATYEFTSNFCIKRVFIYGKLELGEETSDYEYRMNVVLSWEVKSSGISVHPVLGYQFSSIDGKPVVVKELPPNNNWLTLAVRTEENYLIIEDGDDRKKLGRIG